jgi:hypothetical protein
MDPGGFAGGLRSQPPGDAAPWHAAVRTQTVLGAARKSVKSAFPAPHTRGIAWTRFLGDRGTRSAVVWQSAGNTGTPQHAVGGGNGVYSPADRGDRGHTGGGGGSSRRWPRAALRRARRRVGLPPSCHQCVLPADVDARGWAARPARQLRARAPRPARPDCPPTAASVPARSDPARALRPVTGAESTRARPADD